MTLATDTLFSIDFPRAYPDLCLSATFREKPEDFYVEEQLGFSLAGEGEHICLLIEKRSHNTHWVSAALAEYAGINERDIGVCGRKDRHAITRQWFSLYDPERKDVDWSKFEMDGVSLLETTRHSKKLRLGNHKTNHFVIRLRNVINHVTGTALNESEKETSLQSMMTRLASGVPNYFGAQRFGREASNLLAANDWLLNKISPPRKQRGMILSAARSYLFNQVLAQRVKDNTWQTLVDGDIPMSENPTGPLWGRGRLATSGEALSVEQTALQPSTWCERMEHVGLQQERRLLTLLPKAPSIVWENSDLILSFDLPPGTFATALLAEMTQLVPGQSVD